MKCKHKNNKRNCSRFQVMGNCDGCTMKLMNKLESLAFLTKVAKNYQKIKRLSKQITCKHDYRVLGIDHGKTYIPRLGIYRNKLKCKLCGKVI